jgi:hypothetical protein
MRPLRVTVACWSAWAGSRRSSRTAFFQFAGDRLPRGEVQWLQPRLVDMPKGAAGSSARGVSRYPPPRVAPAAALLGVLMAACSTSSTPLVTHAGRLELEPDYDVESIIASSSPGSTFVFKPGTYRMVSIDPKEGDTFIGEPGALLTGAKLLDNWTQVTTSTATLWYADRQTQQGHVHGVCDGSFPRCNRPEDVFINDIPLLHVDALSDVTSTSYYFDYDADRIYIGQDPSGKTVEVSTTPLAFKPTAENVTVRGFVIEKYASPAQRGAIGDLDGRAGWLIEENEVRYHHGGGVALGTDNVLRNNYIHHNGQIGVGGSGSGIVIEGNEIAYNGWNGTDPGWEAGGFKIALSDGLLVRNNYAHHNLGPGLWTDIDNVNTIYEYNTVANNDYAGINHEISYDAEIRHNILIENGRNRTSWLWGSGILIQNSSNVEVYNNYAKVGSDFGRGIAILEQERGSGAYGPWVSKNVYVHDNDMVHPTAAGLSGADNDYGNEDFFTSEWNILFNHNRYHLASIDNANVYWRGDLQNFAEFRAFGQELAGSVDTDMSLAPPAPIVRLTAVDAVINQGESTELTFEGLLATKCSAPWKIGQWVSGSAMVSPAKTTEYSVVCSGAGGTATDTVVVQVLLAPVATLDLRP